METKKVKITVNVNEQRLLTAVAINQLEKAKAEEDGYKFKAILPSMVFSVFSVEALCNVYGSQLFPHWDHFESTSFIGKVVMISDFLGVPIDFSKEPWQTINQMKSFRNILVHAKPFKISAIHEVKKEFPNKLIPYPKSKKTIQSFSTIENAEKFNDTADTLTSIWLQRSNFLGYQVKTVSVPEYEES